VPRSVLARSDRACFRSGSGAPVLTISSAILCSVRVWFIYIALSRQTATATEPINPEIVIIPPAASIGTGIDSLSGRVARSEGHACVGADERNARSALGFPHRVGSLCREATIVPDSYCSDVAQSILPTTSERGESCKMAPQPS
jgi:hypothetical protein